MGNELRSQSWIFDMFILDRIDREIHSLKSIEHKFGRSLKFSAFFDKISLKILLFVLFLFFRFSKASFKACLHEGGGPQVGEVTCGGLSHLTCKRDHIKNERLYGQAGYPT